MPSHRSLLPALALVTAFLLAGCASTTDILRSSAEARPAKPATTVLVAGVSTDDVLRRRYEAVFLAELARAGLRGVASTDIIPTINGLTMAQVHERMMSAVDRADAVLHVQLVNLVPTGTLSPSDIPADMPPEGQPARRDVGGVSLTLNAPPAASVRGTRYNVELEANLYELPTRRLLWTAITRTHEANATDDIARSHARALIKAMRDAGYVAGGH